MKTDDGFDYYLHGALIHSVGESEKRYAANGEKGYTRLIKNVGNPDMTNLTLKATGKVVTPQYTYSGGGYTAAPKCFHGGAKMLWRTDRGHKVYAGQQANLYGDYSVIVDCTGHGTPRASATPLAVLAFDAVIAGQYDALTEHVQKEIPRILIKWPDGGAPALLPSFWRALYQRLDGAIAFCCVGGHGRTGTALAAFYMAHLEACGIIGTDAAPTLAALVEGIRRDHCNSAVETDEQVIYLEEVADYYGIVIDAEPVVGSYEWRTPVPQAQAKPAVNVPSLAKATRSHGSAPKAQKQGNSKKARKGSNGAPQGC